MDRNATRLCRGLGLAVLLAVLAACNKSAEVGPAPLECRVGVVMPTTGEMAPYEAEGIVAARMAAEDAKTTAKPQLPLTTGLRSAFVRDSLAPASRFICSSRRVEKYCPGGEKLRRRKCNCSSLRQ
jgi:hypothetical protein